MQIGRTTLSEHVVELYCVRGSIWAFPRVRVPMGRWCDPTICARRAVRVTAWLAIARMEVPQEKG
jgi:hypothetical protein